MKLEFQIAEKLRNSKTWDDSLCHALCFLAGIEDEYKDADGEEFESVVFKAAEILGVEII